MHAATGETEGQPTVDRAKRELTMPGTRTRIRNVVEQPLKLCGGKIRIDDEPGALYDARLKPALFQRAADIGGAPVLPDDCVVQCLAGRALP